MSQNFEPFDLISASSLGAYSAVENILKKNLADVNRVNQTGWSAVMFAANYGHYNIIRLLVKYRCNVNYQDSQGRTALMLAASNGHTRCIDTLINYGKADKNLKDYSGNDAMIYAKNNGHGNNKLIRNLLLKDSTNGYEVKGRTYSAQIDVMQSNISSTTETCGEVNHIYNPCETTVFSNYSNGKPNSWRPIRRQNYVDNRINGISTSLNSSAQEWTPSNSSSGDSTSSSSHSSIISAPPNFRQKSDIGGENTSLVSISSPMPKSLFHLLTRIELIQYLDVFENNSIDFMQFLTLTDNDFQNLGITSFGHRKKLSMAQKRYHESLDIKCTHESFLADYLLNERDVLNDKIHALEEKIKNLENCRQN